MAKLLRQVYAVWVKDEDYDPNFESKKSTEEKEKVVGPNIKAVEPQREEVTTTNVSKHTYCCHSCGSKGNALDLLVALTKEPLHEAAWQWIETKGLEPPTL